MSETPSESAPPSSGADAPDRTGGATRGRADLGYFVSVVEDACAAKSESSHKKGLAGMKGFSRIISTQQVLEELAAAPKPDSPTQALSSQPSESGDEKNLVRREAASNMTSIKQKAACLSVKKAIDWKPPCNSSAVAAAMLRTLRCAGVKFLRYLAVDACNSTRCKVIPLDFLLKEGDSVDLKDRVAIAEVCFAGLPTFGDVVIEGTNLDARRSLVIHPDLGSIRVLPYSPKTALVLGTAHDQTTGQLSPLCTRGLLSRVLQTAEEDFDIAFNVGVEIEFCLHQEKPPYDPVDTSVFANTRTLNEQEDFICNIYDQLQQQDIEVEMLHAESGPGQMEVVLRYQMDPMKLADNVVLTRETISSVARSHKMIALFLPKIHETKAGNGMHLHLSFRDLAASLHHRHRNALPHSDAVGEMSKKGKSFLEGLLTHQPALMSLTMPTTNSFRRVGPGCWTGHCVCWALDDKEVPLRVSCDKAGRVRDLELKLADSTCNIYLALAGIFACGLDGIARELRLRPMFDPSSNTLTEQLPSSLAASLQCLQKDQLLLEVIGEKLSTGYVALRMSEADHASKLTLENEVQACLR